MENNTNFYVGTYILIPKIQEKSIIHTHRCSNISCFNFLGLDEALKICPKCSSPAQIEHTINYKNEYVSLKDFEKLINKEQLSTLLFCYKTSSIKNFIKEIQEINKPYIWILKKPIGFHYSNNNFSITKEIKNSIIELTLKENEAYIQPLKNIFKQVFGEDLTIHFGIIHCSE